MTGRRRSAVDAQTLVDAVGLGAVYALMAVGIGLVFGVLRLVNFAYGQLIMAGAYALAFASSGAGPSASIVLCFAVVLALSLAMERLVFRPLRTASPAVMLVTTFAIAFLLQSIALSSTFATARSAKIAASRSATLNQPVTIGSVDVRKITIVAIVVVALWLAARAPARAGRRSGCRCGRRRRTSRTARLLGVRANR